MATQLQIRRGTASQIAAFTGAEGEVVVNTTNDSIVVSDGSTAGGFEQARADLNNVSDASLNAALTGNTVSALTITTLTLGSTAITATGAEINILDGVTSTAAELNILDGVTSTTAELNILDGVTSTAAELNILDGVTATTAELNYVDGVTSAIQTQIDAKAPLASPTFTGSVTSGGPLQLTAGALAAAGNAGLSHRSADNKVYLQAGTGGFNVLDDQQNTHFSIDSAGVSSFNNNVGIGTSSPSTSLDVVRAGVQPLRIESSNGTECAINMVNTGGNVQLESHSGNFTIDADNVGIGTSSPATKLNAVDSTALQAEFSGYSHASAANNARAASGSIRLGNGAGTTGLLLDYTDQGQTVGLIKNEYIADATSELRLQSPFLSFYSGTTAAERMRIDSSGNLFLGKTASSNTTGGLTVAASGEIQITRTGNGGQAIFINRQESNGDFILFRKANSTVGSISVSGNTTSYATSSDARLKDVTGEAKGLEVINKLNPVAYNWKADGKADEGLIAQEVMEIVPNAVSGSEEEMYQMDYSKLVTPLIKAIQEQQTQIDALQSEINTLKGE